MHSNAVVGLTLIIYDRIISEMWTVMISVLPPIPWFRSTSYISLLFTLSIFADTFCARGPQMLTGLTDTNSTLKPRYKLSYISAANIITVYVDPILYVRVLPHSGTQHIVWVWSR